ncbi:MAG TPA: glycosyltransferase family 25 protein [Steroidobacteraceae bacterium]|nr:glycosyltransferase family 25 protein [Steroidobacteraceae bacterium]
MDCFYINLDRACERREQIERSFGLHHAAGWRLHRFAARGVRHVRESAVIGAASEAAKACFLSHREVIRASLQDQRPIFVLEDDAVFGTQTCAAIERHLAGASMPPWDILFTDALFPDIATMASLVRMRQRWQYQRVEDQVAGYFLIDMAKVNFASSTAYIVNGQSKSNVVQQLESAKQVDAPYDLFLRRLVHGGRLKALSIFPFVTTLSANADSSQIQKVGAAATDLIWNTFRRLMWTDRSLAQEQAALERIGRELCDEDSRSIGTIFAGMTSRRFQLK